MEKRETGQQWQVTGEGEPYLSREGGLPYFTLLWARISQRKGQALPPLEVLVVGQRLLLLLAEVPQASQPRALMMVVHLCPDTGTAEGPWEQ